MQRLLARFSELRRLFLGCQGQFQWHLGSPVRRTSSAIPDKFYWVTDKAIAAVIVPSPTLISRPATPIVLPTYFNQPRHKYRKKSSC